jgi:hypothetical protein
VTAKRARARSTAEREAGRGGSGAVSGFEELDRVMVGIVRVVRAWRASSGGAAVVAEREASPIVEDMAFVFRDRGQLRIDRVIAKVCV